MSRSNRTTGSNGRIMQLEEENALMERKLGMLKQAMSEERERRQSLKAASPAGGFWRNSGKGTADVRKGKPISSARGSPGSRQKPAPAQETPSEPGLSRREQKQQTAGGSVSSRTTSGAKPLTSGPTAAGGGSKQQVDDGASQRAVDLAGLQGKKQPLNQPKNAQPQPETGMCCGTDDRPGQGGDETAFDGEVDEAANRREFLEALAAWRRGGSSSDTTSKQTTNGGSGTDSSSSSAVPVKAKSMAEGAETGTGTDTVVPKPKATGPYFDKLMREAQARAAGEAAALKVGCKTAAADDIQRVPQEAAGVDEGCAGSGPPASQDAIAAAPMDEKNGDCNE